MSFRLRTSTNRKTLNLSKEKSEDSLLPQRKVNVLDPPLYFLQDNKKKALDLKSIKVEAQIVDFFSITTFQTVHEYTEEGEVDLYYEFPTSKMALQNTILCEINVEIKTKTNSTSKYITSILAPSVPIETISKDTTINLSVVYISRLSQTQIEEEKQRRHTMMIRTWNAKSIATSNNSSNYFWVLPECLVSSAKMDYNFNLNIFITMHKPIKVKKKINFPFSIFFSSNRKI